MLYLTAIITCLSVAVCAIPRELQVRAGSCNKDNCLRFALATGGISSASAYCQAWLSSIPGTVTVTAYSTVFSTPAQPLVTITTGTTTSTVGIECTATVTQAFDRKRAVTKSNPYASSFASACTLANKVPQKSRISSACSCVLKSATATSTSIITSIVPTPVRPTQKITLDSKTLAYINEETSTVITSFAVTETTSTCSSYTTTTLPPPEIQYDCASCPAPYTTKNGKRFFKMCNTAWWSKTTSGVLRSTTFSGCLEYCSVMPGCIAIYYTDSISYCETLSGTGAASTRPGDGGGLAMLIETP